MIDYVPDCPECGARHLDGHPAGLLAFEHLNECSLLAAEDARAAADKDRATGDGAAGRPWGWAPERSFTRPATDIERHLLSALGYALPEVLDTRVTFLPSGIRARSWDDLRTWDATQVAGRASA